MGRTEPRHIALYGSLRRGESAYAGLRLEELLRYRGPCRLQGLLYDLGDYPGLLTGAGDVRADLFEIARPNALEILDAFEECDPRNPHAGLYRREAVTLSAPRQRAWVYLYNRPVGNAICIESGDWVNWRRNRSPEPKHGSARCVTRGIFKEERRKRIRPMSSAENQSNGGPGYARHPEHKVEVEPSPHRMRIELEGETVADSANTLVLHESGHDPVYYFPRADVAMELLEPTAHSTECPFKGTASYWTLRAGGSHADNAVWSYEQPYDEVAEIKDRLAFYPDRVGAIYRDDEKIS